MRRFGHLASRPSPAQSSSLTHRRDDPVALPRERPRITSINAILESAFEEYYESVNVDLNGSDDPLVCRVRQCDTIDAILDIIEDTAHLLVQRRNGKGVARRLREVVKPVVYALGVVLDASAETASSLGVPGGKGIFAAVAVLIKAAEQVSAAFDDVQTLLERLSVYFERLKVRLMIPLGCEARAIAVRCLAEMLRVFALATKMLRRSRLNHFLKALFVKSDDIGASLRKVQEIASDEEKMSVTEVLVSLHDMSYDLHEAKARISRRMDAGFQNMASDIVQGHAQTQRHVDAVLYALPALQEYIVGHIDQRLQDGMISSESRLVRGYPPDMDQDSRPSNASSQVQITLSFPATDWRVCVGHIQGVIARLDLDDQDAVWRAIALLFAHMISSAYLNPSGLAIQATHRSASNGALRTMEFLGVACSFLLLFMACKLNTVTRPVARAPDIVTIIDVFGVALTLQPDIYSSRARTHEFILNAFMNRPQGWTYVVKHSYGIGNSERLLITSEEWTEAVKPGDVLTMSIILQDQAARCPYCHRSPDGAEMALDNGRMICIGCGRLYATHEAVGNATRGFDRDDGAWRLFSRTRATAYTTLLGLPCARSRVSSFNSLRNDGKLLPLQATPVRLEVIV
ncbi:unnamed protein product [Peniophora sp. CBMAI 1063]|nr:unnamed protein product [Peniophora sp. CBMAI 1063]